MKLYFDDEEFDGQFLRAVGKTYYGMADLGECFATAARIEPGDPTSWQTEWRGTAAATRTTAGEARDAGHFQSAGEALLRACEYYRSSYFFNRADIADLELLAAYRTQRECFREAMDLLRVRWEPVEVPYEDARLGGYLFLPASGGGPYPTVISPGGYDGTAEEYWYYTAAAALRRGYAALVFDGPGQGGTLYEQQLFLRPDYEAVLGPVVDWALGRSELDGERLALMGRSFGGYLAPRAASGEHRLAALVADPGLYDLGAALEGRLPGELLAQVRDEDPAADEAFAKLFAADPRRECFFKSRAAAHGLESVTDYLRELRRYTLAGRAGEIRCPTLVASQPDDPQAAALFDALTCEKLRVTFTEGEGAFGHCEGAGQSLFHQRVFDWLDGVLGISRGT